MMLATQICAKRRGGFSLLELFVVMLIMALLIALLLPAVAAVREAAEKQKRQVLPQMPNVTQVTAGNFEQEVVEELSKPVIVVCADPRNFTEREFWTEYAQGNPTIKVVAVHLVNDAAIWNVLNAASGGSGRYHVFLRLGKQGKVIPLSCSSDISVKSFEWTVKTSIKLAEGKSE